MEPDRAHLPAVTKRSPLEDPGHAAHAWARYKRLLKAMTVFTLGVVAVALAVVYSQTGMVSPHLFVATALGVFFTMLLTAALMGLVFLSSGTGHDESVSDLTGDQSDSGPVNGRKR